MRIYQEPKREQWHELSHRPAIDHEEMSAKLDEIFGRVKLEGDQALLAYAKKFDKAELDSVLVAIGNEGAEGARLDETLRNAIDTAYANIRTFHAAQMDHDAPVRLETQPGVVCWRAPKAIEKVGLYVPGGSAPLLSTAMMLGIPARLAGCKEIVIATPPMRNGEVHPAIRYIAAKIGASSLYRMGGAQAIAAMTLGTESVLAVDKIFGPGNQFVTAAKERAVRYGVAIDMPAGPSEVLVMADESTNPVYAAADLLSQAEHGEDSQVVLVASSEAVVKMIDREVTKQVAELPRRAIAEGALEHSYGVVMPDVQDAMDFVNTYAPEHLIISTSDCQERVAFVHNAGSVFIGAYTPESAGDYASGTNHTLPTSAWARSYGGVSTDSFRKYITYQEITKAGIDQLGPTIVTLAKAEGLEAHARAVEVRSDDK